jgi:hypothetical protein
VNGSLQPFAASAATGRTPARPAMGRALDQFGVLPDVPDAYAKRGSTSPAAKVTTSVSIGRARIAREGSDVTVVTVSGALHTAPEAAAVAGTISCEVIALLMVAHSTNPAIDTENGSIRCSPMFYRCCEPRR